MNRETLLPKLLVKQEKLTYWLRAVIGVVFVRKSSVGVVHVLAGVDVEVFLLLVLDFEEVSLDAARVLSQECTDDWVVVLGAVHHHGALVSVAKTKA